MMIWDGMSYCFHLATNFISKFGHLNVEFSNVCMFVRVFVSVCVCVLL